MFTRLLVAVLHRRSFMRSLAVVVVLASLSAGAIRADEVVDEKRVTALIRELDADAFRVREKAEEELKKLARGSLARLQKTLAQSESAEQACRLTRIIAALDPDPL